MEAYKLEGTGVSSDKLDDSGEQYRLKGVYLSGSADGTTARIGGSNHPKPETCLSIL